MRDDSSPWPIIWVLGILLVLAVICNPSGCTKPDETKRVLEDQGYKDVKITGYRAFLKSDDDFYSTGFEAISPSGKKVTGAVTSGAFKGNTIRFD